MKERFSILTLLFSMMFLTATAQKGNIRGTVIEDATGEPLFGVTVVVTGTTTGSVTDFDGKFDIVLDPGTYDIQASFVSYQTVNISGLEVKAGEVTVIDVIRLAEDIQQLEEIVITAEVLKDTEEALLTIKRKSANVLDGISSVSFRKIGDSDAAAAVKRVTGVSVEGGKYVYVRGLGDRYTKSILNGMDIPGLDPDRNTLQMDIFPTNVINNIVVVKSFTGDLPADFVGGLVNIEVKDFPDEKTMKVSGGIGFNPSMHFNSDYLTYEGGKTDWLGIDDGTREIPTNQRTDIPPAYGTVVGNPNSPEGQEYQEILRGFNPTLGAMRQNSFMDYSLGFSIGNQLPVGNNTLGYNAAITYKSETRFYEDVEYGRYGIDQQDASNTEMDRREFQLGDQGNYNTLIGGLFGLAYKRDQSKYKLNFLHLQNGESKAGLFIYKGSDQGSVFDGVQTNLEFNQRALSNLLINGTHYNADGSWEYDWKISPTRSSIEDPDIRFTRLRTDNGTYQVGTESGLPERIWRYLDEWNVAGKFDVKRDHSINGNDSKLKFGVAHTWKMRDYLIQGFQINPRRVDLQTGYPLPPSFSGDSQDFILPEPGDIPNEEIFRPSNIWPTDDSGFNGTTYDATFLPSNPNQYESTINNLAAYVSEEAVFSEKFRGIFGVRMENYQQRYTGQNQQGTIVLDDSVVIEELDFFPTVNLIYALNETQNFRASYSLTTARPSFKEASFAEILDPITGRVFIGGFFEDRDNANDIVVWDGNLRTTTINNIDLRWEMFGDRGQTVSLSTFYKIFNNPIEIVQYAILANSFQPRNVGQGTVFGVEIEARKHLTPAVSVHQFTVQGNVTLTDSKIDMSETEYLSRVANAREGQTIERTRDMAGQAPYLINAGFAYEGFENGLEAGVYYNVQGETLQFVGIVDRPDVYSKPFHSVNLTASKMMGPEDQMRIGLKVDNILNSEQVQEFQSFNAESQIFGRVLPRTSVSLGFSYTFK